MTDFNTNLGSLNEFPNHTRVQNKNSPKFSQIILCLRSLVEYFQNLLQSVNTLQKSFTQTCPENELQKHAESLHSRDILRPFRKIHKYSRKSHITQKVFLSKESS